MLMHFVHGVIFLLLVIVNSLVLLLIESTTAPKDIQYVDQINLSNKISSGSISPPSVSKSPTSSPISSTITNSSDPSASIEYQNIFISLYVPQVYNPTTPDANGRSINATIEGQDNFDDGASVDVNVAANPKKNLLAMLENELRTSFVDPSATLNIKRCTDPLTKIRPDVTFLTVPLAPIDTCLANRKIANYDHYNLDHIRFKIDIVLNMALPPILKPDKSVSMNPQLYGYQVLKLVIERFLDKYTKGLAEVNYMSPPVNLIAEPRPNIVFMLADDLGYGDVGYQACAKGSIDYPCTSKNITPNIDRLAQHKSTVVFSRFYAHTQCTPSRASILTGVDPARLCMLSNPYSKADYDSKNLPKTAITIAKVAKACGYRTYFSGKWHVGAIKADWTKTETSTPGDGGFMEWYATRRSASSSYPNCGCFNNGAQCDVVSNYTY